MKDLLSTIFGAKAQVAVGVFTFVVGLAFWVLGTALIDGALRMPWEWTSAAFIFHASMFFGLVACYAIVATGLGYKATERVEAHVTGQQVDVEHADEVNLSGDG